MRTVLAVIAGYIAMFLLVIILFTIAYLAMGADLSFKPGSYEPSLLWIVVSFVLGLIAAIAGGWICAAIAPGTKAPVALVVVVIVLGLLTSIRSSNATRHPCRLATVMSAAWRPCRTRGRRSGWRC